MALPAGPSAAAWAGIEASSRTVPVSLRFSSASGMLRDNVGDAVPSDGMFGQGCRLRPCGRLRGAVNAAKQAVRNRAGTGDDHGPCFADACAQAPRCRAEPASCFGPGRIVVSVISHSAPVSRPHWRGWAVCLTVVLLLRCAAYYASWLLEYGPYASLWFPAAAITFAACAVFGWRALFPLIVASLLGSLAAAERNGSSASMAEVLFGGLLYALSHCLAYYVLAQAVMRSLSADRRASLPLSISLFLVYGLVAAAFAAFCGVGAYYAMGDLSAEAAERAVLPWMIGDYTAIVALGPLSLLLFRALALRMRVPLRDALFALDDLPRRQVGSRWFALKLPVILLAAGGALWAIASDPDYGPLILLVFVTIVLQFWLVHTQTVLQSLVSIALFDATFVVLTMAFGLGELAATLQCAMITFAAGSYFSMALPMLYARSEELKKLLTHDTLTGAHTRHFFVEMAERTLRQSRVDGRKASMLMIDLDNLKRINDREGHAAGDHALSLVVKICRKALGDNALLGRLGGDEFCAMLPACDQTAAAAIAQTMVNAVRDAARAFPGEIKPSLSIGVATAKGDDDYDSLWLRADTALYVAKRSGRNRVAQEEFALEEPHEDRVQQRIVRGSIVPEKIVQEASTEIV